MTTLDVDDAGVCLPGAASRRSDVDVLRGVAICAVVALHSSWTLLTAASLREPGGRLLATAHLASGFGVPLFLALSAIGLAVRHGEPFGSVGAYLAFLRTRAQRLLPAYVFWSLASLALRDPALLWPPGRVAWTLLNGSADIQFYFIPLLFQLYLAWPLLRWLCAGGGNRHHAVALAVAVAVALATWTRVLATTQSPLPFLALHVVAALWLKSALLDRPERRRAALAITGVLAATTLAATVQAFYALLPAPVSPLGLLWASTIFQPAPTLYCLAAIAFWLACVTGMRPQTATTRHWLVARALSALGRRSYAVFLTHLVVASNLTRHLIAPSPAHSASAVVALATLLASVCVTLTVSYAVGAALERHRALAWLVGGEAPGSRASAAYPAVA